MRERMPMRVCKTYCFPHYTYCYVLVRNEGLLLDICKVLLLYSNMLEKTKRNKKEALNLDEGYHQQ